MQNFRSYLCFSFLFLSIQSYSQLRHQISAGLGLGTVYHESQVAVYDTGFMYSVDPSFREHELPKHLEYSFQLNKKWSIGVGASFNSFSLENTHTARALDMIVFKQKTITFSGKYSYVHRNLFQLYSSINFGMAWNSTYESTAFNANRVTGPIETQFASATHVSLVGVSFGRRLGGYVELGLGYKGVLNSGIFVRL
jgi:hypothetical protein